MLAFFQLPQPAPFIEPASHLVRELGERMGIRVTAGAPLDKDYLCVQEAGAPPKQILALVAKALNARIVPVQGGLRLERIKVPAVAATKEETPQIGPAIQQIVDMNRQYRAAALAGSHFLVEKLPTGASPDQPLHSGNRLSAYQLLPQEILLERLIERIGTNQFEGVPAGSIQIWEDHPRFEALKLPNDRDLVEDYAKQMQQIKVAFQTNPAEASRLFGPNELEEAIKHYVKPVNLRLKITSLPQNAQVQLTGYDAQNVEAFTINLAGPAPVPYSSAHLVGHDGLVPDSIDFIGGPEPTVVRKDFESFNLSSSAITATSFYNTRSEKGTPDWFLHPDKIEPLNLFVGDAAKFWMNKVAPNEPAAMVVPDSLWSDLLKWNFSKKVYAADLKEDLASRNYETLTAPEGTIIRPRDLEWDESDRTDRANLANLTRYFSASASDQFWVVLKLNAEHSELAKAWKYIGSRSKLPLNGESSDPFNMQSFLGKISYENWQALMAGKVIASGKLGIGKDLQKIFEGDLQISSAYGEPAPNHLFDLFSEDIPNKNCGNLPVRIKVSHLGPEEKWINVPGSGWVDWKKAFYNVLSNGDFEWTDGVPHLKISRADFEDRYRSGRYVWGDQTIYTVQIQLKNSVVMEDQLRGLIEVASNEFAYAQLPQKVRDYLWNKCVTEELARVEPPYPRVYTAPRLSTNLHQ